MSGRPHVGDRMSGTSQNREMGPELMRVQIQVRGTPRWHCPSQAAPETKSDLETLEEDDTTKCGDPVEPGLGQ